MGSSGGPAYARHDHYADGTRRPAVTLSAGDIPEPAMAFAAFWRRLSTYIASSALAMSVSAAVPSSGQLAVPRLSATGMSRPLFAA